MFDKFKLKYVFLLPIVLTMIVSISHVIVWYSLSNPFIWSVFMSIAIEVGAMAALVAATKKIKGGVWFVFSIVTFIQMIGNIFYSYKEIDETSQLFKSWVELTSPIWEILGSDIDNILSQKRWLSLLEGGLLPIISLASLHFFIKYDENEINDIEEEIISDMNTPSFTPSFTPSETFQVETTPNTEYSGETVSVESNETSNKRVLKYTKSL